MKRKKLLPAPLPVEVSPPTSSVEELRKEFTEYVEKSAAELGVLQAEIKQMSMTYQRSAKEIVARYYGLTFAQVDLPYPEWAALREKYEKETGNTL